MAQNEKGGSDLDVFEGLGKKTQPIATTRTVPPPPSSRAPADFGKRTLLGIAAPILPSGSSGHPPPARTPPPPPGRSTLPPVVSPSRAPAAFGSVHTTGVDVAWDDEDEATAIFDESRSSHARAFTGPPKGGGVPGKVTLLGVAAPSFPVTPAAAAGSSTSRPPAASSPFLGRSSFPSVPGAPLPAPPATQPGLGLGPLSPRSSTSASTVPPRGSFGPSPQFLPPPGALPLTTQVSGGISDYFPPPGGGMESTALVHPPPVRTGLWVVVGLAAATLIAVAVVFFGAPRTGQIVVNVSDAKGASVARVDVFVDGRKECDSTPCLVDQVGGGSHEVKVVADGFGAPAIETVVVESRKQSVANFALGGPRGSGLKVTGSQPGVKLYVDGKEIGPLPQEVYALAPGDHTIRIAGSERYEPLEKHVTIDRDQVQDLGNVTLKVLHGKVTITLATYGARVSIVSGSDRRELPTLPISVDIDTTKAWSLEASKPGYEDYHQAISFDDGQAERFVSVMLDPKPQASSPVYYPPAAAPAAPQTAQAPVPAQAPPVQVQAAAAPAPAADGGEAYLNINSIPPSTCFVDGHSLGSTPQIHISVKPGAHTVKFINADQGLTKTISVSVNAGETKPAVAKLN
jgi:serine/threonine-protein kinase